MSKRPRPVSDGPLKAYARRAPTATNPRWYWQVVYHEGGQQLPVEGASGRYTLAEVRGVLRTRLQAGDWVHQPAPEPVAAQTWGTLLDLHLDHQAERVERGRLRPRTLLTYRGHRGRLAEVVDHRPITAALSVEVADAIVESLEDRGYASYTVRQAWGHLRQVARWGQRRNYLPYTLLPTPDLPERTRAYCHRTPTDPEARLIVEALPDDWRRVGGEVLYGTGCRPGELADAQWGDWRPDEGEHGVLHLDGKTGSRLVWVSAALGAVLRAWWLRSGQPIGGPLLGVSREAMLHLSANYLPVACKKVGVERITGYGLRRLASTKLIAQGVDPAVYEAQMGHTYAVALKHYTATTDQGRGRAAAILGEVAAGAAGQVVQYDPQRRRRRG